MVGRNGKKSIGDVVETFILTIGGKVYTDSNRVLIIGKFIEKYLFNACNHDSFLFRVNYLDFCSI